MTHNIIGVKIKLSKKMSFLRQKGYGNNMKKIILISLALVLIILNLNAIAAPSDISVRIDGTALDYDVPPIAIDGRTLVPVRVTAESLGADVSWDTPSQTAIITFDDRVVKMALDDPHYYIDDVKYPMDSAVTIIDNRMLIPVRYLAESLGAIVMWDNNDFIVEIITERHYVTIGDNKISIGDPVSSLTTIFGNPDRIDTGIDRFDWYVYNSDYSKYFMAGILDDTIISIYTAFTDFTFDGGIAYGDRTGEVVADGYKLYYDIFNKNSVYGVWVGSKYSSEKILSENFALTCHSAEQQLFDLTNVFRYKNELNILTEDPWAVSASRNHSQDMADNNFLSHTNLDDESPWDRYDNVGGKYYACTESISGGEYSAINTFNAWLNSSDHRQNLLHKEATFGGVGMGYNKKSDYGFYTTQMFSYRK